MYMALTSTVTLCNPLYATVKAPISTLTDYNHYWTLLHCTLLYISIVQHCTQLSAITQKRTITVTHGTPLYRKWPSL